MLVWRRI